MRRNTQTIIKWPYCSFLYCDWPNYRYENNQPKVAFIIKALLESKCPIIIMPYPQIERTAFDIKALNLSDFECLITYT